MSTSDREIFVDSDYPVPPFVDGIVRVNSEAAPEEVVWQEAEEVDDTLTNDESDASTEILLVPVPLSVVEQKVVAARGGGSEIQAILEIEEVPYVNDYEIRAVLRP